MAVTDVAEQDQVQYPADAVSPLFAEVRAQYGAAFDAALARNVADALAEDVGAGDQTGRLVPADALRDALLQRRAISDRVAQRINARRRELCHQPAHSGRAARTPSDAASECRPC